MRPRDTAIAVVVIGALTAGVAGAQAFKLVGTEAGNLLVGTKGPDRLMGKGGGDLIKGTWVATGTYSCSAVDGTGWLVVTIGTKSTPQIPVQCG